ncbi:effector-associated constant component EACC1 [Crossiella sp. CA198]|uniref:effector-associated constant component EACC1 n=1 Tax=Crossiella sp. CA198 TaxID=3455607 RepID=UPI003F8D5D97
MGSASIAISGGGSEQLRELAGWLRDEDELRGRVELVDAPVRSGELGAELEAVVVLVTSGTATVLVRSLFGWLGRRTEARRVSLKIKAQGREVTVQAGSADEAQAVLAEVRRILDGGA